MTATLKSGAKTLKIDPLRQYQDIDYSNPTNVLKTLYDIDTRESDKNFAFLMYQELFKTEEFNAAISESAKIMSQRQEMETSLKDGVSSDDEELVEAAPEPDQAQLSKKAKKEAKKKAAAAAAATLAKKLAPRVAIQAHMAEFWIRVLKLLITAAVGASSPEHAAKKAATCCINRMRDTEHSDSDLSHEKFVVSLNTSLKMQAWATNAFVESADLRKERGNQAGQAAWKYFIGALSPQEREIWTSFNNVIKNSNFENCMTKVLEMIRAKSDLQGDEDFENVNAVRSDKKRMMKSKQVTTESKETKTTLKPKRKHKRSRHSSSDSSDSEQEAKTAPVVAAPVVAAPVVAAVSTMEVPAYMKPMMDQLTALTSAMNQFNNNHRNNGRVRSENRRESNKKRRNRRFDDRNDQDDYRDNRDDYRDRSYRDNRNNRDRPWDAPRSFPQAFAVTDDFCEHRTCSDRNCPKSHRPHQHQPDDQKLSERKYWARHCKEFHDTMDCRFQPRCLKQHGTCNTRAGTQRCSKVGTSTKCDAFYSSAGCPKSHLR